MAECKTSTRSTARIPTYDFSISLVTSNYGVPPPQVISLSSVISTNLSATGHYDIFDPTRQSGGEYYQGMRVRINGLTLVTTDGWTTISDWDSRYCTATDGTGRQFPLIHPLYDIGPAPTNEFDATGVFLQESGSATDGTFGYELFVQEVSPSDLPILNIAQQNGSATSPFHGPVRCPITNCSAAVRCPRPIGRLSPIRPWW